MNTLKTSSTLAVYAVINLSIKLGFVSVNSPRETYFVDTLRKNIWKKAERYFFSLLQQQLG